MSNAKELRNRALAQKESLRATQQALERAERSCGHAWECVKYDPIVVEGYRHPGDAPGTMGVDFVGPHYVAGSTTRRWRRACTKCGVVQYSERTEMKNDAGGLKQEVPVFQERGPAWP